MVGKERHSGVHHGDIDELAFSCVLSREHGCQNAPGANHRSTNICGKEPRHHRAFACFAKEGQRPDNAKVIEVMPRNTPIRSVLTIPGDGAVNQTRVDLLEFFVT